MFVMRDNFKTKLKSDTYVALGSFDGLHLGHMSLINKIQELSKKDGSCSMVLTFENHPLSIINKHMMPKLIMSNQEKIKCLEKLNIDILNMASFNEEFMKISPEDFIEKLIYTYNVKGLVVGYNYRFGYKNFGDIELLHKLSKKIGFQLYIMESVKYENEVVCSTRIRGLIREGNILRSNKMLGRYFGLRGVVIKGKQFGRTMGFPTVNLDYDTNYITPKGGVYMSVVEYKNKLYTGITNIGYNPTVNGDKLGIETHILDFNENVYGERLSVYFLERIREEKKFDSPKQLAEQLEKDKEYARRKVKKYFSADDMLSIDYTK